MGYRTHLPRRDADTYLTDPNLALSICQRLSSLIDPPVSIIEPSAGAGAFVAAARQHWPNSYITAIDCREDCRTPLLTAGADDVVIGSWEDPSLDVFKEPVDLIIGNPPYKRAEAHIQIAKNMLKPGGHMALLLRMGFLSSQKRANSLWAPPNELRYWIPLAQRPCFTGDGNTENSDYSIYVWLKGYTGNTEILPHIWS